MHRPVARFAWACSAALALGGGPAHAAIFRVGSGPGCDVPTLDDALAAAGANGPGADEIRLPEGRLDDLAAALSLVDQSLTIRGGYLSCFAALGGGVTTLHGAAGVLRIGAAAASPQEVELEGLLLEAESARVIDVDGPIALRLSDSGVSGGQALGGAEGDAGGGVRLRNGASLSLAGASSIDRNAAGAGGGGGVYCSGSGSIALAAGSRIALNSSQGDGGGVYLDHCSLDDASGGARYGDGGIVANSAMQRGGGLFAQDASLVSSGTQDPTLIADNSAGSDGGGLYLTGADASAALVNTRLERNAAAHFGGGLYVTTGAAFQLGRYSVDCPGEVFCVALDANQASSGSAIYVDSGTTVSLKQLEIRGNVTNAGGAALDARGANTILLLEGAVLYDHAPQPAGHAEGGAWLRAAFVSTYANGGAFSLGADGSVSVYSSVVQDEVFLPPPSGNYSLFADCVIAKETASIPVVAQDLDGIEQLDDPVALFKHPDVGDFRPRPQARSIDRCDTFRYAPTTLDVFGFARGFDMPSVSNPPAFGPIDQGAIEAPWIFAADFD